MKKFLCLVLTLTLAMSVFAACGKKDDANKSDKPQAEETSAQKDTETENEEIPDESVEKYEGDVSTVPPADVPAPSTNEEVATEETAPDVYIAMNSTDNAVSISYHLKDCSLTKGLTLQQIAWESVKELGFWQCPNCNPPRYEGYIE